MANKRIGTLTVGIFLVILGVLLLARLAMGTNLTRTLIDIWPIILIALGVEILYHRYRTSQDEKLRYDFVSMLVLFIVGMSAAGLYTLQASGVLDMVKKIPDYSTHNVDIASEKTPIGEGIDRVVIENSLGNLKVRVIHGNAVEIHGSINLLAANKEEARRLVEDNKGYIMRRQGENLIIEAHGGNLGRWFLYGGIRRNPLEILVPADVELEIDSQSGDLDVAADRIEKDWFVRENYGHMDITLPAELDADITAVATQIIGNLDFTEQDKDTVGSENETSAPDAYGSQESRTFHTQLGKAGPRLNLINTGGTIAVYQR